MRAAIFFVVKESVVEIMFRRFGTNCRTHPEGSIDLGIGTIIVGQ
jgi:hypothetical protein